MRIIPAIDLIDGKCVRLTKGLYETKKVYNENPLEVAKMFEANGIQYLHLVDLDGAKAKKIVNYKILESIAQNTQLKIDFGGGLRTDEDVKIAFENGAAQITGGSIATSNPTQFLEWLNTYGSKKIILGADSYHKKIATDAWATNSDIDIIQFIKSYQKKGIQQVIATDIALDGMLQGPSIDLYKEIIKECNIQLIASGGVATLEDVKILNRIGCEGVIIGKAFYEGTISLKELQQLC